MATFWRQRCTGVVSSPILGPKVHVLCHSEANFGHFLSRPTQIHCKNVEATSWRSLCCVWICIWCFFGQLAAHFPKRKCKKYTFYKIQKYGWKIREIQERSVLRDRPVQRFLKVCDMGGNSWVAPRQQTAQFRPNLPKIGQNVHFWGQKCRFWPQNSDFGTKI